jgi:hypothetical protein
VITLRQATAGVGLADWQTVQQSDPPWLRTAILPCREGESKLGDAPTKKKKSLSFLPRVYLRRDTN